MGVLKVLIAGMSQTGGGGSGGGIGGTTGTTDNAITRANGTGGSTLQGSLATIDDSGGIIATTLQINTGGLFRNGTGGIGGVELTTTSQGAFANFTVNTFKAFSGIIYIGGTPLVEDADNILAQRNGANGQTWIVSRTFTDASNKSEATLVCTGTVAAFTITEAGTGIGTLTKWTFNKNVSLPTLNISAIPTSSSGLSSGDVWSNLGILTIVS